MTNFPRNKLGFKAELLLNGTWTDITAYVQLRNPVSISPFGRTNEASSMQAAQATLTLKNTSGRFTPSNSSGAYYPYVQLNTQIRLSVNDSSVNGTAYSGYRFWGEVTSWPSAWDESGRDVYADITAAGIWDRLSRSTKKIGSPYTRYNNINIRNAWTLASYWPMEDGSGATSFANLVTTQAAMTVTSGTPTPAAVSAFNGSDAIPSLNGAVLTGTVSTSSAPANVLWRFGLLVPSGGDKGASGVIARLNSGGTAARVEVSLGASGGGPMVITGYNSTGGQLFTGSSTLSVWGIPMLVEVSLAQSGTLVNWVLRTMLPGGTTANTTVSGSITGTVSDVTGTVFNTTSSKYQGTAVGQSVVIYGNPAVTDAAAALAGWPGEFAGARFNRICSEQGIPAVLNGSSTSGTTMGPQADDTLANVLSMIEATDGGQLFETRTQFGLGYRTLAAMQNQVSAVTLSYNSGQLFTPLVPVTDASLTRNDVTLTNYDGYAVRAYLASGARSIQSPPNGVGTGYEYTGSVSSSSHSQVQSLAQQILDSGTVSDPRYPAFTVNLAAPGTASLFSSVPSLNVGDYVTLASMPAYGGAATQKQLVWGWSESIGVKTWTITFNAIPEAPYESGYAPGTVVSGQVPGSPVSISQANSVAGAQIAESAISLYSLAQQVLTYNFGGITSTISGTAPATPNVGDLWFDASNGYEIKRWNGSSWDLVTFNGTNILGAGTITAGLLAANAVIAGNIAAGVVTATQLAAGIVKAGIVDGTTISGAQFVAYGTTGEILVYSGTPASGNLVMSVSASAGTDSHGNGYPAGLAVFNTSTAYTALTASSFGNLLLGAGSGGGAGLEMAAQPSTPSSQNSILYSSVGSGAAAWRNGSGGWVGQLLNAATSVSAAGSSSSTYTIISASRTVPANDAAANTVYRITCYGYGTYSSGNVGWQVFVNGAGQATASTTGLPGTFTWESSAEVSVRSSGSGGTATIKNRITISETAMPLTGGSSNANPNVIIGATGGATISTITFNTTVAVTLGLAVACTGTASVTCVSTVIERIGP